MNIVLMHPHDIYNRQEPWTIRIVSFAREFVKRGHAVRLIHFTLEPCDLQRSIHPDGFEVVTLHRHGGAGVFFRNFRPLMRELAWADVIHFQKCFHYVSIPAVFAAICFGKRIHYDWDDLESAIYETSGPQPSRITRWHIGVCEAILPRVVDTVSVASDALRQRCRRLGVRAERIFDAPVGADLERFKPALPDDAIGESRQLPAKTVLYVGQLHGAQYVELLLAAVSILKTRRTDVRYLVVGTGSQLEALKARAAELGVADAVQFTGAVPYAEVPGYMAACDVAVACFEDNRITRAKSPLKVVEYLAAGKAIVGSAVGEVKKMLDGCGVCVPPGDPAALAAAIDALLSDPARARELGVKARVRAEEIYNWPRIADNLLAAFSTGGVL